MCVSGQGRYLVLSLHWYVKTTTLDHLLTLTCNLQSQWPINVHRKLLKRCKFAFNILLIILGALKCLRFHKLHTQKKRMDVWLDFISTDQSEVFFQLWWYLFYFCQFMVISLKIIALHLLNFNNDQRIMDQNLLKYFSPCCTNINSHGKLVKSIETWTWYEFLTLCFSWKWAFLIL